MWVWKTTNGVNLAEWIETRPSRMCKPSATASSLPVEIETRLHALVYAKENRENIKKLAINMSLSTMQPKEFADMVKALPADKAHMEGDVRKAMEKMIALKDDAVTDEAVNEFIDVFSDFIVETSARGGLRKGKIERDGWVFTDD